MLYTFIDNQKNGRHFSQFSTIHRKDKVGKPICRPSSSNFSSWYGAMDLSICPKLKDLDSMQLMALPYINGITKCKKD
jgi:hypothetical protein